MASLSLLVAVLACVALAAFAQNPTNPPPGILLKVTVTGEVGILLDEFPADTVARAVNFANTRPESYWREAAQYQVLHTRYRLIYRPYWYPFNSDGTPKAGQLPIPNDQLSYQFTSAPTRKTIQGHDVVTRTYVAEAFIVTDEASALAADNTFGSTNGQVNEVFNIPVDPYLIFQRTGYDCMDEEGYPLNSVDAENSEFLYDDSCGPEPPYIEADGPCADRCHCTGFSTRSCTESVKVNVGGATVKINYRKVPWDETFARSIEALSPYNITFLGGADLIPNAPGLRDNYIGYQYVSANSCTNIECIETPGWRRLLYFDAANINVGGVNMEIGFVDFVKQDPTSFDPDVYRNLYYWDACHQHPHFAAYATYTYGTNNPGRKQGFCIQTTGREINARWAPITTKSYTCDFQGVDVGWSDSYQAGMPCQWVDITSVRTKTRSVTQALTLTANPKNWLCEGVINNLPNGSRDWVSTGDFTATGQPIDKYNCTATPNFAANNVASTLVTVPTDGNGLLTAPCPAAGHNLGPKRDCEFTIRSQLDRCTPGSQVRLSCSIGTTSPSQVMRVCESSLQLGSGLACRFNEAHTLANVVLRPGTATSVSFTSPAARDAIEVGGAYSTYSGPAFNGGDAAAAITCHVV